MTYRDRNRNTGGNKGKTILGVMFYIRKCSIKLNQFAALNNGLWLDQPCCLWFWVDDIYTGTVCVCRQR